MKKTLFLLVLTCMASAVFSQAKKPTLMIVPSDVWCNQNGYTTTYDNMGTPTMVPDYKKALQSNPDLLLAISKIGEMMAERGFPLKDLGSSLKNLETEAAEESVTAMDRGGIAESPVDKLRKVAKADIWLQLTWSVNAMGPKKSLTFNLQGLDAYTDKQIAASSGTGDPSFSAELPVLLEEAILSHIDQFNNQLQNYFDDLFANGREVSLECKRTTDSDVNFESEIDDNELAYIIEDWVSANTREGRFNTSDVSENRIKFEQVRIPLFLENGRALDTRTWARGLQKELRSKYYI